MPEHDPPIAQLPRSRTVTRRRTPVSLVWVIPILAALVGVWIAVTRVMGAGPKITIKFDSAEGLEAGKTRIRYKGVEIGTLTGIRLTEDHHHVLATAQMAPKTEDFLLDDTRFWVVRPRISGANVTGLGTLISGAYVGIEIGKGREHRKEFVALETPPVVVSGTAGRVYILKADNLGSLDTGTPIYFRRLQVGEIASYQLDKDGKSFTIQIFVKAPYDRFVKPDTRFWQASGVDVAIGANGLSVETESFLSILIGGVAFENPAAASAGAPAAPDTVFGLYDSRAAAFAPSAIGPQSYQLVFNESVRGLEPGAPVEFRGIPIGEVTKVSSQINLKTFTFTSPVTVQLDARRLGVKIVGTTSGVDFEQLRRRFFDSIVAHGARAQLRTANLLTGAAMVSFDLYPDAPPATIDWSQYPPRLPTIGGQLEATEASVIEIIDKINQIPFDQIGYNLNQSLADLDLTLDATRTTMGGANDTLGNLGSILGADSAQLAQLGSTLNQVSGAARSIRVLSDYLERHPEALLRGKPGEAK